MATTPTNKPIPSEDPRDLKFNAGKIDEEVNGSADYYTDRFGAQRLTNTGRNNQFQTAQDEREAEFVASQENKELRFQQFLLNSGYQFLGDYENGPYTIDAINQVIRYQGEFWRLNASTTPPYTTTGVNSASWAVDVTHLVSVGDAVLRQELSKVITWLDLNSFDDLDKTGATSVTSQLSTIFANAYAQGIRKVVDTTPGNPVYRIGGSEDFVIPGLTFEMENSEFIYDVNWTGQVVITDPSTPVTVYDSSTTDGAALLSKINASSAQSKLAQSLQIDGLINDTTLNNNVCIFDSGIGAYYSRGNIRTWKHIALISTRGLMSDALYYSLTGTVSSVTAWQVKPNTTIIKLPKFNFEEKPHAVNVLLKGLSRYEIWGPNVSKRPLIDDGSEYVISMVNCFDCEVRWGYDIHPNVALNGSGQLAYSSYTLNYNFCLDCRFINQYSMGFGWGSTAGEVCSNTTFINCKLNRFDFHEPMQGRTSLIDCTAGDQGISMCGMGRLDIIRTDLKPETLNAPYPSSGTTLIKTRDDIGGWFDGDIYIENCIVSGGLTYNDNNSIPSYFIGGLINLSSTNPAGDTLPAGSPVVPRLFRDVTIKGLKHLRRYTGERYSRFIYSNLPQYLKHPESITLDDFDYFCDQPLVFGFGNWLDTYYTDDTTSTPMAIDTTCHVTVNRGAFAGLTFAGTGNKQNISVKINQARDLRYGKKGVAIVASTRGVYDISDSDITSLSAVFGSSQPTVPNVIKVTGGTFKVFDNAIMPMTANDTVYHDVSAANVAFLGDFSASTITATNLNLAKWFKLSGCQFFTTTGTKVPYMKLFSGSIGTTPVSVSVPIRNGNDIVTQSVYNSLTTNDTFKISSLSGNLGRKLYNGADGGYFLNISITGNRALINSATASAAAMLREIYLAA